MISRRDIAGLAGMGMMGLAALAPSARAEDSTAETTFNRVRRTRKLRIGGVIGTEPYYHKDLATGAWSGFCISMGRDLARVMEAELEVVETTWGNAVLDLQANKIDIMFGLSPTPPRALVVEFTRTIFDIPYAVVAKRGFEAKSWDELNRPEVRVAVDIGSIHDIFVRRVLPKCTLLALKNPDEATLAVQAGRADCVVQLVLLAMATVKKNPNLGHLILPTPLQSSLDNAAVRVEADHRFRTFVDTWIEYNRPLGAIRTWVVESLALVGIEPQDIPASVQF